MKLIITGHDFSGKTTFLKNLYNELNDNKLNYIHLSYKDPTTYDFYKNILLFNNFIMDRCFIDELIYPTIFSRDRKLKFNEATKLINFINDNDIQLFLFECSDKEIKRRINLRNDEELEVLEHIYDIKKLYKMLANIYKIPIIDTTNKTYDEIKKEIFRSKEKIKNG